MTTNKHRFQWMVTPLAMTLLWGCAFSSAREIAGTLPPPGGKYSEILIGDFRGEKLSPEAQRTFSRAIQQRLKEEGLFEVVALASEARTPKPSSLVLTGEITEFTEGNRFLQWFIGFGAGASEAGGRFELLDSQGNVLRQFDASSKYAGGLGIGGAALLSTEDLLDKLAATVAEETVKWMKGESTQETEEQPL